MSAHDRVSFVLKMARAMHGYGYASHRMEEVLAATSQRLGLEAQFFSTPTSIFAAFGTAEDQRTHLLRVEPGDTDLSKLAAVDRVSLEVLRGSVSPAEGARRLDQIAAARPTYGPVLTTLAFGVSSAAAARFFGGGWAEIQIAGIIGLLTGILALATATFPPLSRIFEPLAAFLAATTATAAAVWHPPLSVFVTILGGLIALIPGMMLTVAMTELATRHLVSGTSRLSAALLLFLTIIFGVALGTKLMGAVVGVPDVAEPIALPLWTELLALAVAPLGFGVLLRAAPRDLGWVLGAGWLAYAGSRLGSAALGPELGAFVGAVIVGVASNAFALWRDRPSQIMLVPGVLLLVPGSFGLRSVAALLEREVISGVETAFTMVFIATALVSGILFANVLVPRRKSG